MIPSSVLDTLTESEFQSMIVDRARARGWLIHHDRRQDLGIGGDAGFPDLVLARAGVVLFVEVKTARGRLSEHQRRWLEALGPSDANPYRVVWRPDDWSSICHVVDHLGSGDRVDQHTRALLDPEEGAR